MNARERLEFFGELATKVAKENGVIAHNTDGMVARVAPRYDGYYVHFGRDIYDRREVGILYVDYEAFVAADKHLEDLLRSEMDDVITRMLK